MTILKGKLKIICEQKVENQIMNLEMLFFSPFLLLNFHNCLREAAKKSSALKFQIFGNLGTIIIVYRALSPARQIVAHKSFMITYNLHASGMEGTLIVLKPKIL